MANRLLSSRRADVTRQNERADITGACYFWKHATATFCAVKAMHPLDAVGRYVTLWCITAT